MAKKTPQRAEYDAKWKRENRLRNRIYLQEYKAAHICSECGEKQACCLVFHHRDPSKKKFDISFGRDKKFALVVAEVRKCNVMCANCHLELHARQQLLKMALMAKTTSDEVGLFD